MQRAVALLLLLVVACAPPKPAKVEETLVTVHYRRHAGDYEGWQVWVQGKPHSFGEKTAYGVKAEVRVPGKPPQVAFSLRKGTARDVAGDRFIEVKDGKAEVWLLQGDRDVYAAPEAVPRPPRISAAYLDGRRLVRAVLAYPTDLSAVTAQEFTLTAAGGVSLPIAAVQPANPADPAGSALTITLAADADPAGEYTLQSQRFGQRKLSLRGILDDPAFTYAGDDLGATYTPAATQFRVWAPTAEAVSVALYDRGEGGSLLQEVPMQRAGGGTWAVRVAGDLKGRYYTYRATIQGRTNEAVDPYAVGVGINGNRGLIVHLPETNPPGWEQDRRPPLRHFTDAVIYEIHVRDLSVDPNSGITHKGKFLGFTERGTRGPGGVRTGLDHLVELGVTHVHLLPAFDYASVDEGRTDQFNWGYDPKNYNVPEGSYATDPTGSRRITEFKQMVQALHRAGLRVVMDVVYNHTYEVGTSSFDLLVPGYYYRLNDQGRHANGSGVGNETASERAMMRRFIVDSVRFWATEYRVDGFRFDLMALHDRETMRQVRAALDAIDPSIIVYGEPWTGGPSPLPAGLRMEKGSQRGMRIAVFNDHIRNAIKGDNDGSLRGFATGAPAEEAAIRKGVLGCITDFCDQPGETINYASSHDNLTLWDKIAKSNPGDSEAERIQMDQLSQAIVLTSQGIPFMQGGEEMLRTKGGNPNSYNAPDSVNRLDWERKLRYWNVFRYYQGLIALRRAHPAFRLPTADLIRRHLEFLDSPAGTVAFRLKDHAGGDEWREIVVIYNPHRRAVRVDLPGPGRWTVVVDDDEAGLTPVKTGPSAATGAVAVPPIACMVLYQP